MANCASLSLFRFDSRLRDRAWVFTQMGLERPALARTPDIGFWKLVGSGTGEGFNARAQYGGLGASLATWPDLETARDRTATAPVFARWRGRASESWTVFLSPPPPARGQWAGTEPFQATPDSRQGPIASDHPRPPAVRPAPRPAVLETPAGYPAR